MVFLVIVLASFWWLIIAKNKIDLEELGDAVSEIQVLFDIQLDLSDVKLLKYRDEGFPDRKTIFVFSIPEKFANNVLYNCTEIGLNVITKQDFNKILINGKDYFSNFLNTNLIEQDNFFDRNSDFCSSKTVFHNNNNNKITIQNRVLLYSVSDV